jgi:hypothetical protein
LLGKHRKMSGSFARRDVCKTAPIEKDRAAGRTMPGIEAAEKGRFSAAIRANHGNPFAGAHRKVDPVEDSPIFDGEMYCLGNKAGTALRSDKRRRIFRDISHGGL